jgi:serine/threonine-protein kinase RsbW
VVDDAVAFVAELLCATETPTDAADALQVAVVEAVGNVVRHAAAPAGDFSIGVHRCENVAVIEILDHGPGFNMRPSAMPDALAECGRGVALMQQLCDSVEYRRAIDGNRLVLKKRISPFATSR